ncbi:hypothetical protein AYI68_g374, partial [Smittium mucronatum]
MKHVSLSYNRESWCTANKYIDISDHMPITAEWNFDSLEIPAKKIKINANRILLAADQLINSNRFSPLIDADMDLNQLSEGLIDTVWAESKRLQ